jgi:iron(II)-dependent oxidoreductase
MKRIGLPGRSAASAALLLCAVFSGAAQDTHVLFQGQQIAGPDCLNLRFARQGGYKDCTAAEYSAWLADVTHWRSERRIRIAFDNTRYRLPALTWTQSSFIQPQAMVQDRYLYDPKNRRYTVSKYLADLTARYGGIDAVLLWPTYPNLGIDDRNQQQMILSMPGGAEGIRTAVDAFHRAGVRVLLPIMLWDQGTTPPDEPWPEATADLMKQLDIDGVNGDTQEGVPVAYSIEAESVGHPLAFEPEKTPSDEALAWNVMNWGQYEFPFTPMVDRFKWIEPRHMINISDRWRRDRTDDLQFAFFNGIGWESWENIWGIWNGISPRDGEATRRIATLDRALTPFLVSQDWQPFYATLRFGVFASRWPGSQSTVFTLINRNSYAVSGEQLSIPFTSGERFFDLYHGSELKPRVSAATATLSFVLEANGYGAIAAVDPAAGAAMFTSLVTRMRRMTERPLASFSAAAQILPQNMLEEPTAKVSTGQREDMVLIPANPAFLFNVHGVEIEGGDDAGVDVQYPWEELPRRFHRHVLAIPAFYLDRTPVTNEQFHHFLVVTHYHPLDMQNFLRDWQNGDYPRGAGEQPVTWVSRGDAEAYARWAGKRLPHEWEWQYAAQGTDERTYPWGNLWLDSAIPAPQKGRRYSHPEDVTTHPAGASPFGVLDMVGNVWQWTDEFQDEHTRAATLRGGSAYQPQGSVWYFPQAYRNDQHGKYLLMAPGMDRAATIGFRCAADVG